LFWPGWPTEHDLPSILPSVGATYVSVLYNAKINLESGMSCPGLGIAVGPRWS
jgi:hypothetical protein